MSKAAFRNALSSHVIRLLRRERERRRVSMNVLAQRSGLAQSTISRVEHELRSPSLDTLLRIAEVLDVKLEHIFVEARRAASKRSHAGSQD